MADLNRPSSKENLLEEPGKLPDMINVLSILTFIGCGLALCFQLYYSLNAKKFYDATIANQDKIAQAPSIVRSMQGPDPIGVATRTYENRVPILLLGVVAVLLCIYGAVMMRKLKKTGFYIYVIGEILPTLSTYIFIGAAALSGFSLIFTVVFTGLFIILYATQLKYMS
jgi:hypothetical protein